MIRQKLYWFVILISVIALISCSEESGQRNGNKLPIKSPQKEMKQVLTDEMKSFLDKYPIFVVISEKSCLSCNKKVVEVTSSLIRDNEFGVVLETNGGVFDISSLLNEEFVLKVKSDYKRELSQNFKMSHSFILTKVDSGEFATIAISSDNSEKFEEIFQNVLSKN